MREMQFADDYLWFVFWITVFAPMVIILGVPQIMFPLMGWCTRQLARKVSAQRVKDFCVHLALWGGAFVFLFAIFKFDFVIWLGPLLSTVVVSLWVIQGNMSRIQAAYFVPFDFGNDDDETMSSSGYLHGASMSDLPGIENIETNPATGLPMVGGIGGWDVGGHLWGQSTSIYDAPDYHFSSGFDDGFSSNSMHHDF
jgi:hypothetical protein